MKVAEDTMPASTEAAAPTVPRLTISRTPVAEDAPLSPDGVIFEYLKTNRNTDEYLERLGEGGRLKELPEFSRTLNILPEGPRTKDLLEDLGHKSIDDDEKIRRLQTTNLIFGPIKYSDESRCVDSCVRRMPHRLSILQLPLPLPPIPLPRQLRDATLKRLKHGFGRLCRRRTVTISEYDPVYKVAYLGNVLTGWAKGDGCVEKPLAILWRNYTASSKPDVHMKVTVTSAGLRASTREHGLTEYWSHRITHCAAPAAFPWVFCWVYRHEGRKLKQELRCHAVLCSRPEQARRMADQVSERLAAALLEFRREKLNRQRARLSLAGALHDSLQPARRVLLATGSTNYRPPLDRSKSAPKLGAIEEDVDEEEGQVFGRSQSLTAFLHKEEMANLRRHRFGETVRRKLSPASTHMMSGRTPAAECKGTVVGEVKTNQKMTFHQSRSRDAIRSSPWIIGGSPSRFVRSLSAPPTQTPPRLSVVPEPTDESEESVEASATTPDENMPTTGRFVLLSAASSGQHPPEGANTDDPADRDEASSSSSLQSLSSEGSQDPDDEHRRGCCDEDCVSDESGYVEADALLVMAKESAKASRKLVAQAPTPPVAV